MIIMSVESTCDETAVALVRDGREILTDQIFSQADLHAIYGGVVPEIASRSHVEVIYQLADRAIAAAGIQKSDIDAVAVSYAPGLIGAVLVGVNFAKASPAPWACPSSPFTTSVDTWPPTIWPILSWSRRSCVWWYPAVIP